MSYPAYIELEPHSYDNYPYVGLSQSYPEVEGIDLWEQGCWLPDGTRNCTTMCGTSDLIWGDSTDVNLNVTANVANCVNYLIVSTMLDAATTNESIIVSNKEVAEDYGIMSASQTNLSAINASTSSCLQEFCRDNDRCLSNQWQTRLYDNISVVRISPT